jgi:peroxiredoxin Q/BCP
MLNIGDAAPDFDLLSTENTRITLKDLRGKKVVLYFYPRDSTPGCTQEACSFSQNIQKIRRKGAVVLGVSADSVKSHQKFTKKYTLAFPLLSDETKDMLKAYGVWKQKSFLGKKFMGIERTTMIIDENGTITHIFPKVKVIGHTDEILQHL